MAAGVEAGKVDAYFAARNDGRTKQDQLIRLQIGAQKRDRLAHFLGWPLKLVLALAATTIMFALFAIILNACLPCRLSGARIQRIDEIVDAGVDDLVIIN